MSREIEIEKLRLLLVGVGDISKDLRKEATKAIDKGYRKAPEVIFEAVDDFQRTRRRIFLNMCNGNDYNTLNLLQIDSAIEALYDSYTSELKKKYNATDTNVGSKESEDAE